MSRRVRIAVLAVLALGFTVAVVVTGQQGGDDGPERLPGGELLGPEPGEQVAGYLERAGTTLPVAGAGDVWALVQFAGYQDPAGASALVAGARPARVVLRVPLPRVQTAQVVEDIGGQHPVGEIPTAMTRAAQRRTGDADRNTGRAADVARAEADRLARGCACVLAVLVYGDRPALDAIAGRSGVRAVHAAAPRSRVQGLALAPLLPEQDSVVGPVPDDGPVP